MDEENKDNNGEPRRVRTKEDFDMFCNFVLEYAKYDEMINTNGWASEIPVNNESFNSETIDVVSVPEYIILTPEAAILNEEYQPHESESGTETIRSSWVTCTCGNHLVTRLMLKCSNCRIWVHLSCAEAKINNIADNFKCTLCDPTKSKKRTRKTRHQKSRKHRK